jgi:hypothetical protein
MIGVQGGDYRDVYKVCVSREGEWVSLDGG